MTGYQVTPWVNGVALTTRTFATAATTQTITGLANGSPHRFSVRAVNAAGVGASTDFSNSVVPATPVEPPEVPGAPTGLTVSPGSEAVRVGFTAPADDGGATITGYRITPYAGSTALAVRTVSSATSHVIGGLVNGTAYTFTVQAVNSAGTGPKATSPSATPRTLPGAPGTVTATAGDGSASVSWVAPTVTGGAPVTGYEVTPWVGGAAQPSRSFATAATTRVISGLTNGTSYRFSVRAVNAAGVGASSGFSNPVVPTRVDPPADSYAPYASWDAMVTGIFSSVLGRAPTSSERSSWVTRLSGADTAGDLVAALRATPDQTGLVDPVSRLYRAYFLRSPDVGGLNYWVSQRRAGRSLYWISEAFARSTEFTALYGSLSDPEFMNLVYRQVLEREPEPAGHSYWTEQLQSGRKTRGMVMVGFSEAAEYKTRNGPAIEASVAHLRFLRRAPTSSELQEWVDRRRAGTSVETLYDELVDSAEHAARVS